MAQPLRNRDELISSFSSKLFSAMLKEVIMDATLQSHKDVMRGKNLCPVCGTRCGSAHAQGRRANGTGPPAGTSSTSVILTVPSSPLPTGTPVAATSTPATKEKNDGNIYFECTNCQKKIASNRYAPHLSGCLGIGPGSRRGAARNAAVKNKLGAEAERAGSPLVGSDYGSPARDTLNGNRKGKAKGKKMNGKPTDGELSGNNKRPTMADGPSARKSKKQKTSVADSDTAILAEDSTVKPLTAAKIPVKLGASPYSPGSPSGASGSQYSGRGSPSASASHSVSSFNAQSPTASRGSGPPKHHKMTHSGSQKKRGRPPGSGRNQTTAAEGAVVKRKTEEKAEDLDFVDVDGEEQEEESSDSS